MAEGLSTALTSVSSSLLGADGVAVDGSVSEDEFRGYAAGVLTADGLVGLAFSEPVAGVDLDQWEADTGVTAKDTDGAGGFRDAARRELHVVVRWVAPSTEQTRTVAGLDLLGEPVRAAAVSEADRAAGVAVVGPISLASSARPGVFFSLAVRDPDGGVVGYVSSGVSLDDMIARASAAVPDVDLSGVEMDGVVLIGERRGEGASFELAGRTFMVFAGSQRQQGWWWPVVLGVASVALAAGTAHTGRRHVSERRRNACEANRARQQAELAERLVDASTTVEVMQLVANQAGAVVGAIHTNVGQLVPTDRSKLQVFHDDGMEDRLADRYSLQRIDDDLPLPESARTGSAVVVSDPAEFEARYPHAASDVAAAGIRSMCCVPLSLGGDRTVGVIGFAFDTDLGLAERREVLSAGSLIAQMTGRAFERALTREIVQQRVDLLAEFARTLTTARSTRDVEKCVRSQVPALLDAESVDLSATPSTESDDAVGDVLVYEPSMPGNERVVVRLGADRIWTGIDDTLAVTIVDLIGGALTRTRETDQERAVIRRIQESLLAAPTPVPGWEVAVAYRSALDAVGMGGDWYSVVNTEASIFAVIGDVAGHGPAAVALMAEAKTVIRHMLAQGIGLAETMEHAHHALTRRNGFGSALIVEIDRTSGVARYLNAGHLPILRYRSGMVSEFGEVHRPLLGVDAAEPRVPSVFELEPDDVLLLFTDGLVEERREPIEDSIRQRLHGLDTSVELTVLVDKLVDERVTHRSTASIDDDIALVAIRRHHAT